MVADWFGLGVDSKHFHVSQSRIQQRYFQTELRTCENKDRDATFGRTDRYFLKIGLSRHLRKIG